MSTANLPWEQGIFPLQRHLADILKAKDLRWGNHSGLIQSNHVRLLKWNQRWRYGKGSTHSGGFRWWQRGCQPWREAAVSLSELLATDTALLGLGVSLARGRPDFWLPNDQKSLYFLRDQVYGHLLQSERKPNTLPCSCVTLLTLSLCVSCFFHPPSLTAFRSCWHACLQSSAPVPLRGVP